jgi:predicted enzyme related to lactoylglutathione lyase
MVNVLSSRILLRPADLERSRAFYRDDIGLAIYREFGQWQDRGTVFFLGGGFLEVSGHCGQPPGPGLQLWLQVDDVEAFHQRLLGRGVAVVREPRREPWGLVEMWVEDPDGVRICVVEVPEDHPMRYRP